MRIAALVAVLAGPALGQDDAAAARAAIAEHGCGTCHVIPGIPGADGLTGPPLTRMHSQPYIAGVVPNEADLLAAFIMDPQAIDPRSAMPDLGVSGADAARIAAYLRTRR